MDPVTISDLAAAFAKLEKRVVVLEEEKEELKADNKELKAGKAEQEKRVTYLVKRNKQQAKEIQAIKGQLRELQPPAAELVFGWARRWSGLMGLGGLIGPGLGLGSVLSKDALMASKMAWASASFLVFSVTCLIATTLGNVRNIGTRGEKALVCLCGLLGGAACFLPGYTVAGSEDEHATYWGWLAMGVGVLYMIILPPIACKLVSMWSQLEDHELSMASDIDLDVTKDVLKAVSDSLSLTLYLPTSVDADEGSAKFDSSKGILSVELPVVLKEW